MRSKTIFALGLLNVILLACLCCRNVLTSTATAQVPRIPAPSEYLMVSGESQGAPAGVVYVIDTRNNLMGVRTLNQNQLVDFDPIDLSRVFK
jgi:hypothetical protein